MDQNNTTNGYNVFGIYQGVISPYVNTYQSNQQLVSNLVTDPTTPNSITDGQLGNTLNQINGTVFSAKEDFDVTDNTAGYRLGFDMDDNICKFLIGNASNYLFWDGETLTIQGTFVIGGTIITINDITLFQTAINTVSSLGGGTVALVPGTYNATTSFTVPSNVTIDGNGATIDFGGGARQFLVQGTNPYTTGTASISFGSSTITGSGTTWVSGMIGQSILLGDFWYTITARASNTSITIDTPFKGTTISGDTYVIATTVNNVALLNLTVQNSSISLIKGRYISVINIDSVTAVIGDKGFEFTDTFSPVMLNFGTDSCTTSGAQLNNCPYATIQSFNILNGAGVALTRVSNCGIGIGSWQRITGVALSYTNCYNIGLNNYSIIECTSHGIEFVSGNNDLDAEGGYINTCGGDGIKLTATSDRINMSSNSLLNNTGYGINIANSNCDNNIILGNNFSNNTAGNVNNSGTSTIIKSNQGVADFPASSSSSNTITYVASNTLKFSDDASVTVTNAASSYTKFKEILLNEDLPAVRVTYRIIVGNGTMNGRLYKNGVAIGTPISPTGGSGSSANSTEDFTGFLSGDLIQVYCNLTGTSGSVDNFRLSFDETVTKMNGSTVITPIPLTFGTPPTANS